MQTTNTDSLKVVATNLQLFNVNIITKKINEQNIYEALKTINLAPKPILVHCKHGADRTGAVIAFYRMVYQYWSADKAIEELIKGGHHFHKQYKNIIALIKNTDIYKLKRWLNVKNINKYKKLFKTDGKVYKV